MPHPRAITLGVPGKIVSKQTEGKRMKWTSAVKYAHNNKLNENKWTSAVKYAHNKKLNENKWTSAVKYTHNNKLNENGWNEQVQWSARTITNWMKTNEMNLLDCT